MNSSANISPIAGFCKELRDARRYRQITLPEVAGATRVSLDYLDALENGRWDDVPRAYLRGYLELYASAVGMNREKVLRNFDRLVSPQSASASVEFDDAPRALRQPQEVGVTRAKIRSSWFAQLSRNRRALYLLTLVVLVLFLAILRLSRRPQEPQIPPSSFADALTENREHSQGPYTVLTLEPDSLVKGIKSALNKSAIIIGAQRAQLTIRRGTERGFRLRIAPFDTVVVPFNGDLTVSARPAASVRLRVDSTFISPEKSGTAVEDVFFVQAGHPLSARAGTAVTDSL